MATIKVTFTLDRETVRRLRESARRLARPQSAVVREAIHDFSQRVERLSETERLHLLRLFDDLVPRIPKRADRHAEREMAEVRRRRRAIDPGRHLGALDALTPKMSRPQ